MLVLLSITSLALSVAIFIAVIAAVAAAWKLDFLRRWPRGRPHPLTVAYRYPAAALHKTVSAVAIVAVAIVAVLFLVAVAILAGSAAFVAFALARFEAIWPGRPESVRPIPMPDPSSTEVDLLKTLGPYNGEQGVRLYDAVFEGGGVKAIGHVGAIARFQEEWMTPKTVVGTSGGAIAGALLAAGARAEVIWQMLSETEMLRFMDVPCLPFRRWLARTYFGVIPLVPWLALKFGAARGDNFRETMSQRLKAITGLDTDPTFSDLQRITGITLKVIATDVTRRTAVVLPDDISDYDHPAASSPSMMSVADAVRMSMSIPFVFRPFALKYKKRTSLVVDGGVCSNYPIWYFDTTNAAGPSVPTFGFLLNEPQAGNPSEIRFLPTFVWNVAQSGIGAIDRILSRHDMERTIRIEVPNVGATDFAIDDETKIKLFRSGYKAATDKLHDFDWNTYVRNFRGGRARVPDRYRQLYPAARSAQTIDGVDYA